MLKSQNLSQTNKDYLTIVNHYKKLKSNNQIKPYLKRQNNKKLGQESF